MLSSLPKLTFCPKWEASCLLECSSRPHPLNASMQGHFLIKDTPAFLLVISPAIAPGVFCECSAACLRLPDEYANPHIGWSSAMHGIAGTRSPCLDSSVSLLACAVVQCRLSALVGSQRRAQQSSAPSSVAFLDTSVPLSAGCNQAPLGLRASPNQCSSLLGICPTTPGSEMMFC